MVRVLGVDHNGRHGTQNRGNVHDAVVHERVQEAVGVVALECRDFLPFQRLVVVRVHGDEDVAQFAGGFLRSEHDAHCERRGDDLVGDEAQGVRLVGFQRPCEHIRLIVERCRGFTDMLSSGVTHAILVLAIEHKRDGADGDTCLFGDIFERYHTCSLLICGAGRLQAQTGLRVFGWSGHARYFAELADCHDDEEHR